MIIEVCAPLLLTVSTKGDVICTCEYDINPLSFRFMEGIFLRTCVKIKGFPLSVEHRDMY